MWEFLKKKAIVASWPASVPATAHIFCSFYAIDLPDAILQFISVVIISLFRHTGPFLDFSKGLSELMKTLYRTLFNPVWNGTGNFSSFAFVRSDFKNFQTLLEVISEINKTSHFFLCEMTYIDIFIQPTANLTRTIEIGVTRILLF